MQMRRRHFLRQLSAIFPFWRAGGGTGRGVGAGGGPAARGGGRGGAASGGGTRRSSRPAVGMARSVRLSPRSVPRGPPRRPPCRPPGGPPGRPHRRPPRVLPAATPQDLGTFAVPDSRSPTRPPAPPAGHVGAGPPRGRGRGGDRDVAGGTGGRRGTGRVGQKGREDEDEGNGWTEPRGQWERGPGRRGQDALGSDPGNRPEAPPSRRVSRARLSRGSRRPAGGPRGGRAGGPRPKRLVFQVDPVASPLLGVED